MVSRDMILSLKTKQITMKKTLKKAMPLLLAALVMSASMLAVGCKSEDTMYGRKQTNKGATVKSNIKVKGSNKANGHTTRSY